MYSTIAPLPHQVSLEELYNGNIRKLSLQKNVICSNCNGYGGKPGSVKVCGPCRGAGHVVRLHQLAPGMMQQVQMVCSSCEGVGEIINPKDKCRTCMGVKVNRERKILEVHIDKG